MKLQIFDFDDTLFRTSAPMSPVPAWYDKPESLDPLKHHIPAIETIVNIARATEHDPKVKRILITKRVPELTADILRLLRDANINLDRYCVIGHKLNKPDVLANLLATDYVDIDFTEIEIYEDCLYQVLAYQNFFPKFHYPNKIDVKYFFVDKTHLIELPIDIRANVISKLKIAHD